MKKFSIAILVMVGCVGLLGLASSINEGLRQMLDQYGHFNKILWSNGQTTLYSDIGSGSVAQDSVGSAQIIDGSVSTNDLSGTISVNTSGTINAGSTTATTLTVTGSATVSAGLLVDTNTLTVDAVNNKVGIGTTTPATVFQTVGTITATGYSGDGTGLSNVVKQVGGTGSGNVFTDPTFQGVVTMPSQMSTTGSSSVATGNGFDQTYTVQGAGVFNVAGSGSTKIQTTGNIKLGTTSSGMGSITVTNGSVTIDLLRMPQVWAQGSTTVTGTSTIVGTTQGTFTTFVIPPGSMGKVGWLDILPLTYTGSTTTFTQSLFVYITDGVATATVMGQANLQTTAPPIIWSNTGSTSVNVTYPSSAQATTGNTNAQPIFFTINTGATMTVTLAAKSSHSTGTVFFLRMILKANYCD